MNKSRPGRLHGALSLAPFFALWLGLLVSGVLFVEMRQRDHELARIRFDQAATAHADAMEERFQDLVQTVWLLNRSVHIFAPHVAPGTTRFQLLVPSLRARFPFIETLAFAPDLPRGDASPVKIESPGAPGQDVFVRRAVASDIPAGQTLRMPEQSKSFIIAVPAFRHEAIEGRAGASAGTADKALAGYTTAIFDARVLAADAFNMIRLQGHSGLEVSVYAGAEANPGTLVFFRSGALMTRDAPPGWLMGEPAILSRTFAVAGTPWQIQVRAAAAPLGAGSLATRLVLVGSILFSVFIAAFMQMLTARSRRIQGMVDDRTRELRAANARLLRDIAARKQAEQDMRHAQQVLTVAQKVAHLGSWELDGATGEMQCSDELFRIVGLVPQSVQLTLSFILDMIHPEDREATRMAIASAREKRDGFRHEQRIVRPDGSIRHVVTVGEAEFDDRHRVVKAAGSLLDVTEQKETELALRCSEQALRELAAHQERIREDERKRIAREVHDELGALLTGIKAYLSVSIETAERAGLPANQLLVEASDLADQASQATARIIAELRPSVLDHLGIWTAVQWYAEQTEKRTGLACECTISRLAAATEIDPDRSTVLFRIVQEVLTNVVRHAQATRVDIGVQCTAKSIVVEIEDNGKGIESAVLHGGAGWGIVGIHERARHFGGEFDITGTPGKGTVARLRLPLENSTA